MYRESLTLIACMIYFRLLIYFRPSFNHPKVYHPPLLKNSHVLCVNSKICSYLCSMHASTPPKNHVASCLERQSFRVELFFNFLYFIYIFRVTRGNREGARSVCSLGVKLLPHFRYFWMIHLPRAVVATLVVKDEKSGLKALWWGKIVHVIRDFYTYYAHTGVGLPTIWLSHSVIATFNSWTPFYVAGIIISI